MLSIYLTKDTIESIQVSLRVNRSAIQTEMFSQRPPVSGLDRSLSLGLPARQADEVPSVQQPDLAEEDPIHEGNGCQLLQGKDGLELKFFLLAQESHE